MPARPKPNGALQFALHDASKLVSFAKHLDSLGKPRSAIKVWCDAGAAEEIVSVLLEAVGRTAEAGVHRASAATCYEKGRIYPRAVSLLQAALAAQVAESFKRRLRRQLQRCLSMARSKLESDARRRGRQPMPV